MNTSSHYKTKRFCEYSTRHARRIVKQKTQKDNVSCSKVNEEKEKSDSSELSSDEINSKEYNSLLSVRSSSITDDTVSTRSMDVENSEANNKLPVTSHSRVNEEKSEHQLHYRSVDSSDEKIISNSKNSEFLDNQFIYSDDSSGNSSLDDESWNNLTDESSKYSTDDFEDIDEFPEGLTIGEIFTNKLREWAVTFHITLIALTALLLFLQPVVSFRLPQDARTLMGTLRNVKISEMSDGQYYHFGLKRAIEGILREYKKKGKECKDMKLIFNVDGLPIFNSTNKGLWMILCSEINARGVYPVGAYFGPSKPNDANEFMKELVQELCHVIQNGVEGENIKVFCSGLICDVPAKSFVLYLKGHTGYNSCSKCCISGEYSAPKKKKGIKKKGRVCFPGIGPFKMKNDVGFMENKYDDFSSGNETILKRIPGFGCISSVPLDYMHLILLGVMKKLIYLWILGPAQTRINVQKVDKISKKLLTLRHSIPKEFGRKPRSLAEFRHWKATEFRTFLLYSGPIVLKNILPEAQYENFILLHCAVTILCSLNIIQESNNIDCAHEMLERFVIGFQKIYGKQFVSHNVHNLLHICFDVKKYGPLDHFSAFRFENYMSTVKKMIRKGDKPLEQIARRYHEAEFVEKKLKRREKLICKQPHNIGPLTETCKNVWQQYKILECELYTIDCSVDKNRYVLLKDGKFVTVLNIIKCNEDDIKLIIKQVDSIEKLYDQPDSRYLNIHIGNTSSNSLHVTDISNVLYKVWRVPSTKGIFLLPLQN